MTVIPDKKWADCASKKRYRSPNEAHQQIKVARRKRDTKLRAYRCPYCNGWHLTKKIDE